MFQIILCYLPEYINVFFPFRILIGKRASIYSPCLSPCPRGTVTISLTGRSVVRFSGLHIEKECMPCGEIFPNHIFNRRVDMFFRYLTVLVIACFFRRPVQQRQIQQAVDDEPVIFRRIHRSPCLNELAYGMISCNQLVRRFDGRLFSLFVSRQFVGRHTGRRIQKAHIMVLDLDFVVNSV